MLVAEALFAAAVVESDVVMARAFILTRIAGALVNLHRAVSSFIACTRPEVINPLQTAHDQR